jgi:hypothetical protein
MSGRERERVKNAFSDIPIHKKNSHQHNNETLLKLHREQLQWYIKIAFTIIWKLLFFLLKIFWSFADYRERPEIRCLEDFFSEPFVL